MEDFEIAHKYIDYIRSRITSPTTPENVIKISDDFGNKTWLMAVGDKKGAIVDETVKKYKPKVMVELGGYVGYSAIRFSALLKEDPEARYFSFELNPTYAEMAREVIALAGLQDKVTIIVGAFSEKFGVLKEEFGIPTVDMFFIDHAKEAYLPDFQLIERNNMLRKGSVVIADNILYPGAPDYLAYVQSRPNLKTELIDSEVEYTHGEMKDAVAISIVV
ncbi:hypothetical protein HK104_001680 [Borealophlyctis nickersoniae]|nr:hypothetical protein HK104_001680 [Borealophlyctis nickersoniae]